MADDGRNVNKECSNMDDDTWMTEESIFSEDDKEFMKSLSAMGEHLRRLKARVVEAEDELARAKKEYEHWANVVLPQEMYSMGVESITLASGDSIRIRRNFYCQPNKNADDRKVMLDWLRSHGGGHLIVEEAQVGTDNVQKLKDAGIPFVETSTVNTHKLKAWLKDGIGASTGQQRFTIDEIPRCMHFQEVTIADIDAK